MSKAVKLLVAIPTLDYIHRKFVESLTGLVKHLESNGPDFDVHFEGCTLVYISRDNIVKKAMEGDYTEVLWLDADMVFDKDIYWKLRNVGKDFVTAIYRGRHGTHRPCIFEKLEPPECLGRIWRSASGPVTLDILSGRIWTRRLVTSDSLS